MDYQTIVLHKNKQLATVTLNRPEVRNAFNAAMVAELTEVFGALGADPSVRVIVLAAQGPAFCAGGDLKWMQDIAAYSHAENEADAMRLARMMRTVYECSKPVVARIHGDCYAGGMGLAAACDIAIAAESVHFCLSEVRLGLIPATIAPYVIKAMGERAARRYFVTAERFSAQEALRLGLVHQVVKLDELDQALGAVTDAVCAAGPQAVAQAKRLVRDLSAAPVDDAVMADTAARIADIRGSQEGQEGIRAFLDKRKPAWRND